MRDLYNRWVCVVIFMLIVVQAAAQQDRFILSGRVLDAHSKEPVSIGSLQNGRELTFTNVKGEFQIQAIRGDRPYFSNFGAFMPQDTSKK